MNYWDLADAFRVLRDICYDRKIALITEFLPNISKWKVSVISESYKCIYIDTDLLYALSKLIIELTDIREEEKAVLSWKDVLDGGKCLPGSPSLFDIIQFAKSTTYKYIAFNGQIYDVKNRCYLENVDVEILK